MNSTNHTTKQLSWWEALFGRIEVKLALKTGIAASLALFLGLALSTIFERPDVMVGGLWCVMTAIVVLQLQLGGTYKAAWVRFLGVLVGSIVGSLSIYFLNIDDIVNLGISIFFTIIICSILNIKDSFRIASLSTAVIIILGEHNPTVNPWVFSLFRFLDSCIGIIVAVFVAHVIWPERASENLRFNLMKCLTMIGKYYRLAVILEPESGVYEKAVEEQFIDIQKLLFENRSFLEESKLEVLSRPPGPEDWTVVVNQVEMIFESVAALGQVKKTVLVKIFDDSLFAQISNLVDKTDVGFQELEKLLESQKSPQHLKELEDALKGLSDDLLRFRGTRTTRKFNLEDVESFFVFFYRLRAIGESVLKLEQYLQKLFSAT